MAQYGFYLYTISRLQGGSAVRAIAYILRDRLYDKYNEKTWDYSHSNDFLCYGVVLPDNAPLEFNDPMTLINAMENEKRYDARTGRGGWLSLPNELESKEWVDLVTVFVKEAFVSLGMGVIWAIHDNKHPNDPAKNNPNAHFILTDRPMEREGFCAKKNRSWNRKSHVKRWRKLWADIQNRYFERKDLKVRVDHESLQVQGSKLEPTIPLGRVATEMEKRGIQTERGNRNRIIETRNKAKEESKRPRQQERKRSHDRDRGR